jgi:hypothetical protein
MERNLQRDGLPRLRVLVWMTAALIAVSGCGGGSGGGGGSSVDPPDLAMDLPESLTGENSGSSLIEGAAPEGPQCNFDGSGDNDPFKNGYYMTKFLVGIAASTICMSDFLMTIVPEMKLPGDGSIQDVPAEDDPYAPTGVSYTKESGNQRTIRAYWNGNTEDPGMYFSWVESSSRLQGRLINTEEAMGGGEDPGAPTDMRMDFNYTSGEKSAQVYFAFPADHPYGVTGFRVSVTRDEDDGTVIALGRMDMSKQPFSAFDPDIETYITETPVLMMYTVANEAGSGAAVASFADHGIGFDIPPSDHLGYYRFTNTDKYFFTAAGAAEWINKTVTAATYEGGKSLSTITESNIDSFLSLSGGTTAACTASAGTSGTNCVNLLNGIFDGASFSPEQDAGSDPGDWRSTIISGVASDDFLSSPYPSGYSSWDGVFDMDFNP